MRFYFFLALTLFLADAAAEPTYITIPDQGWHLSLDAPAPSKMEGSTLGSRFRYTASDPFTSTTYSVLTEPFTDKTHTSCRDLILSRAKDRPAGSKEDKTKLFEAATFSGQRSRFEVTVDGRTHTMATAHAFFVEKGRCVDVHVSQFPYSDEALDAVEAIVRTVKVVK